jgi:hypothetical protein
MKNSSEKVVIPSLRIWDPKQTYAGGYLVREMYKAAHGQLLRVDCL